MNNVPSDPSLGAQWNDACQALEPRPTPKGGGAFSGSGLVKAGIVLAGVGVLVVVTLSLIAISNAREAARLNGCLSNIRQLALATT